MPLTPEQEAREDIDAALVESGWLLQNRAEMNLAAGAGVAVREFRMTTGHGFAAPLGAGPDRRCVGGSGAASGTGGRPRVKSTLSPAAVVHASRYVL